MVERNSGAWEIATLYIYISFTFPNNAVWLKSMVGLMLKIQFRCWRKVNVYTLSLKKIFLHPSLAVRSVEIAKDGWGSLIHWWPIESYCMHYLNWDWTIEEHTFVFFIHSLLTHSIFICEKSWLLNIHFFISVVNKIWWHPLKGIYLWVDAFILLLVSHTTWIILCKIFIVIDISKMFKRHSKTIL